MKPISEATTEDLMAETKQLHDLIYNIGISTSENNARMEALYAELTIRGYGVVEQFTVEFVESVIPQN